MFTVWLAAVLVCARTHTTLCCPTVLCCPACRQCPTQPPMMCPHHLPAAVLLLLLPVVQLLLEAPAAVSAQPQRADAPIIIIDLACPTDNVITLEPSSDLFLNRQPNTTYLLRPGPYTASLPVDVGGDGAVVCYVGLGSAREDVVVTPLSSRGGGGPRLSRGRPGPQGTRVGWQPPQRGGRH